LARLSHAFGSRAYSIVAPYKLGMAAKMGDAAASKYFLAIAGDLSTGGLDAEIIDASIHALEIDEFTKKNEINMIVTSDGRSGLCRWPGAIPLGKQVPFIYEHVFRLEQPVPQKKPRGDKKRRQNAERGE
jgi:hypothetical protein